jgi:hypothetical protein
MRAERPKQTPTHSGDSTNQFPARSGFHWGRARLKL